MSANLSTRAHRPGRKFVVISYFVNAEGKVLVHAYGPYDTRYIANKQKAIFEGNDKERHGTSEVQFSVRPLLGPS